MKRTTTTTANYYFQKGRLHTVSLSAEFVDGTEVKVTQDVNDINGLSELFRRMSDRLYTKTVTATRLSVEAKSTYNTKEKVQ